jgi:hypothetical protein
MTARRVCRQQRCGQLAAALMQATASLETLEKQTHTVQAAQERELSLFTAETTLEHGELQHKAKMLELENFRLQDELAALSVSEEQNRVLRQTLDRVRKTAALDAAVHDKEMCELRESMVEKKAKLQREYKNLVQTQGLSSTGQSSQAVSLEFLEVLPPRTPRSSAFLPRTRSTHNTERRYRDHECPDARHALHS